MSTHLVQCWLVLSEGQHFGLWGTCTLGRSSENTLPLADEQVSRRHAIIQAQGENEFWLVDLGSSNGTSLNGRRVAQPVQLHKGDVIELGATRLEFQTEALTAAHPAGKEVLASTLLSVKQIGCWLLMADIIGSTRLSQRLAPEEFPRVTGTWFKECRQIIDECGGHISKYLGDGFFCHWEDGTEAVSNVTRALERLQAHQRKSSPPFRIVLHHGMVVLGSVPTMSELNLHGPQVNFLFRMEKLAGGWRESVLLSEPAWQRLGIDALQSHEGAVEGFEGIFKFYIPEPVAKPQRRNAGRGLGALGKRIS